MIWVEQPVGVGYSQGIPNITNEIELAAEFRGFWKVCPPTSKIVLRPIDLFTVTDFGISK
jgi:hypothetical protein